MSIFIAGLEIPEDIIQKIVKENFAIYSSFGLYTDFCTNRICLILTSKIFKKHIINLYIKLFPNSLKPVYVVGAWGLSLLKQRERQ